MTYFFIEMPQASGEGEKPLQHFNNGRVGPIFPLKTRWTKHFFFKDLKVSKK